MFCTHNREATLPPDTGLETDRFTKLTHGVDHYAVGNSHVHRSEPQAFSTYMSSHLSNHMALELVAQWCRPRKSQLYFSFFRMLT